MHPRLSCLRRPRSARSTVKTPPGPRIGRCPARPIHDGAVVYPVRGAQSGARPLQKGPQIMAKYVFSFRVPSDYRPDAGTPGEWQAWFGELGSALVDVGNA